MISFLKLIRYKNLLMVLLTMVLTKYALIPSYLSKGNLSNSEFIFLSLSIILIAAGGYIINDLFDIEADKINKPHKVFVTKTISIKHAWISYFLLSLLGISIGIYISFVKSVGVLSIYFISSSIGLFIYSKYLKKLPLVGNLLISLLIPLTIFLVYKFDELQILKRDIINNLFLSIVIFYYLLFAFFSTLIREIIKDIEDIKGDYKVRMKTLPIILGQKRTQNITISLSLLFLFFIFLILSDSISSKRHVITFMTTILALLSIYFIHNLWSAKTKKQFHFLSNLMKLIMLIGILSLGLFKFM